MEHCLSLKGVLLPATQDPTTSRGDSHKPWHGEVRWGSKPNMESWYFPRATLSDLPQESLADTLKACVACWTAYTVGKCWRWEGPTSSWLSWAGCLPYWQGQGQCSTNHWTPQGCSWCHTGRTSHILPYTKPCTTWWSWKSLSKVHASHLWLVFLAHGPYPSGHTSRVQHEHKCQGSAIMPNLTLLSQWFGITFTYRRSPAASSWWERFCERMPWRRRR